MTSILGFIGGSAQLVAKKITGSTAVVIVDATDRSYFVSWLQVNENAGATPNLTVDLYDGTNSYPLADTVGRAVWDVKAVTAKQSVLFDQGYPVPKNWQLRVKSSDAAGKFNLVGAVGAPV
jgi:hypothetical protein